MRVYADSSKDTFNDLRLKGRNDGRNPLPNLGQRNWCSQHCSLADATLIALTGHSRSRYKYGVLVDQALHGTTKPHRTRRILWSRSPAQRRLKNSRGGHDKTLALEHVALRRTLPTRQPSVDWICKNNCVKCSRSCLPNC